MCILKELNPAEENVNIKTKKTKYMKSYYFNVEFLYCNKKAFEMIYK